MPTNDTFDLAAVKAAYANLKAPWVISGNDQMTLIEGIPALLAECEYQAQAIEELVATVDDMIVQRNKAEAENERLTAERDRLRGLLLRVTNLCSQFKFDAEEWQTVKDARAALAEGEGDETND